MRLLCTLSLLACALLAACRTAQPPALPTSAPTVFGVVSGTSQERVSYVARVLDELAPQIPLVVPGCDTRPIDVRLVAEMAHSNWRGATFSMRSERWMELPEAEGNERLAATMAHELVHYLLGSEWSTLPGVLEEGLCDKVAHTLVPGAGPLERAEYAVILGTALDGSYRFDAQRVIGKGKAAHFGPEMMTYTVRAPIDRDTMPTFEEALRLDSRDLEPNRIKELRVVLDALGYLIVSRIGVHDLHQLCRRAHLQNLTRVPPLWLLEAAGLERADRDGWRIAVDGLFGDAERRALLLRDGLQFQDGR
ncbi:MAG: hypothetical protein JNL28_14040 [Planctomycetes bacterium]|nr:hypothetical protein [Planctomycetota bacterium]